MIKHLYKYRDWNNAYHRKILQENNVFLAPPNSFEDKMDCNVPESFPARSELYNIFLEKSKRDNTNYTRREHRKYARYWCEHSPLANPKQFEKVKKYNESFFNHHFGVLCLTANPYNNIMWEKYGNLYEGFCVGFDTSKLFKVIGGGGGEIQYVDTLPIVDFINDDFKTKHIKSVFFKEKKWEFEQEYRLHKTWKNEVSNDERNIKLPENCIIEVILGKNMPDHHKHEIKEIIKSNYSNVEIKELTP